MLCVIFLMIFAAWVGENNDGPLFESHYMTHIIWPISYDLWSIGQMIVSLVKHVRRKSRKNNMKLSNGPEPGYYDKSKSNAGTHWYNFESLTIPDFSINISRILIFRNNRFDIHDDNRRFYNVQHWYKMGWNTGSICWIWETVKILS